MTDAAFYSFEADELVPGMNLVVKSNLSSVSGFSLGGNEG